MAALRAASPAATTALAPASRALPAARPAMTDAGTASKRENLNAQALRPSAVGRARKAATATDEAAACALSPSPLLAWSRARAVVAAGLAALSAANALSMAARVHPLITWTQYQDLLAARGVVEPGLNASVACRMSPYWVQYVLGLRPFSRGGAQVVVWCPGERPPPRGVEVFRGREVSIYRVRP
ncbi:MAG: hypothetical protein DRO06_03805 [Thermoproteota archaeon]|nr:MAG: hypothetical protein DRO06_03805 [Candidatus Korarchaeota archaeon]